MKIENKYVNIQIGNKSVRKHNFFLDSYLKLFSLGQQGTDWDNYSARIRRNLDDKLFIKLDTPLENVDYDTELQEEDFDMIIYYGRLNQIANTNNISVIYNFDNSVSFWLKEEEYGEIVWNEYTDRSMLDNKKITAISFGNSQGIYTFLDISDYNLYFENSQVINISREDLITTDAICKGYDYPYHLGVDCEIGYYERFGVLQEARIGAYIYSVGLGYNAGIMEEEYVIGQDATINVEDDNTYNFVLTKAVDSGIYPSGNIQPMTTLHPRTFKITTSIYPSPQRYAGNNLYPRAGDYKYIIMKYKLYYRTFGEQVIETGDEYTMSFYTEKDGVLTIKDKIERSDA